MKRYFLVNHKLDRYYNVFYIDPVKGAGNIYEVEIGKTYTFKNPNLTFWLAETETRANLINYKFLYLVKVDKRDVIIPEAGHQVIFARKMKVIKRIK